MTDLAKGHRLSYMSYFKPEVKTVYHLSIIATNHLPTRQQLQKEGQAPCG